MKRALLALFIAPLLSSLMFGLFALFALPFMLAITVVIALPLLLVLRRAGWLQWWHSLLAGAFCGACFVAVDTALSYAPNLDRLINSNNVMFVILGAGTGLAYWWIGIYRNPAFPGIPKHFPWSVVVAVPIFVVAILVRNALLPSFHQGRVLSIVKEAYSKSAVGQASVRLTEGAIIQADLSNIWTPSMVEGKCFHIEERWSTFRARRIYELIGQFGAGGNDC
ncbi:MAG: hypothetical protein P4L83_04915 [Nevskia sp.]|nr:hypothetical protein [Nevskia sp.]